MLHPVTPELLRELLKCAPFTSLRDLVFSSAFLFAFFLFARISNLAPASVGSFDPKKDLCRGDIVVTSFGLLVSFKWSKTNQTGAKPLTIPSLSISDSYLCPVRAYLLMCSRLPAPAEAPAFFTAYHSSSYAIVTKSQFVSVFRDRLPGAYRRFQPFSVQGALFPSGRSYLGVSKWCSRGISSDLWWMGFRCLQILSRIF